MSRSIWAMLVVAVCCQTFIARAMADEPNPLATAPSKTAADPATRPSAIDQLEQRILAARREIKTAELKLQLDNDGPHGHRIDDFHIWVGPDDRARCEQPGAEDMRVQIFGDAYAFEYSSRPGQMENTDRSKRVAIMGIPKAELAASKEPFFLFSNPLGLMFNPVQFGILHAHKLDDLIGASDRAKLESHTSTWNGEPSIIVSFHRPRTDNNFEYEVVPSRGFNIVRWRLWGQSAASGNYNNAQICQLQKINDSIWFPSSVTTVNTRDGQIHLSETLTIKVVSMNRPLDDKIFTLAGLPPGQLVAFDMYERDPQKPRRPPMIWDGEKVRPYQRGDFDQLPARKIGN